MNRSSKLVLAVLGTGFIVNSCSATNIVERIFQDMHESIRQMEESFRKAYKGSPLLEDSFSYDITSDNDNVIIKLQGFNLKKDSKEDPLIVDLIDRGPHNSYMKVTVMAENGTSIITITNNNLNIESHYEREEAVPTKQKDKNTAQQKSRHVYYGSSHESKMLPEVDVTKATHDYSNGTLTIVLPKTHKTKRFSYNPTRSATK